jgi:RNA polymerase sigma-70 factor (ECF subfamily)
MEIASSVLAWQVAPPAKGIPSKPDFGLLGWKGAVPPRQLAVAEHGLDENQAAELLLRRCRAGESGAWEQLVRQYHRRVFSICYRFTGSSDEAQDLTQEAFIRMYRSLDSYDIGRAAFMTWVATLTRNLLIDNYRRSKPQRQTDSLDSAGCDDPDAVPLAETLSDPSAGPEARLQAREARELVHAALQKISPELREAVILRDLQDMDYKEIAAVLKVPEGTVKSRINRGRTELARLLARTHRQVG